MPKSLHILYEHAAGYTLFGVKEFEEIASLQPEVEKSVLDLSRFNSIIHLISFSPFKSGANALDNVLSISEGVMHPDLKAFLEANLPAASSDVSDKKKKKAILGVSDARLSTSINAELGMNCMHTGVVCEIIRGLRFHGPQLIRGMTNISQDKAQLGLGHAYSRSKVKFNAHRSDNMIIQSINLLDQQDKNINTFVMRLKEWYSYHFPELVRLVSDNTMYAKCVIIIGNRKGFSDDKLSELEEVIMDTGRAEAVVEAAKTSMGMEISEMDMVQAGMFARQVVALMRNRESQHGYLKDKMDLVAPNVSALIGDQLGARLIAHAGSLTNLAKYPASTVQILGAEKALFRALKTKGNTPKYGHIFKSTFIGRAGAKNKGRISRNLANKCSIASRIDCFSDNPSKIFGETLREQVEERLKFYESGEVPRKNVDVMKEAVGKFSSSLTQAKEEIVKSAKKKKKKRKISEVETAVVDEAMETNEVEITSEKKKKKKSIKKEAVEKTVKMETVKMETVEVVKDENGVEKKKKKKKKSLPKEE